MSKRREKLRQKVAQGRARRSRGANDDVPGLTSNPVSNLIMADALIRTGSLFVRKTVEKNLLKGASSRQSAQQVAESNGLKATLTSLALARIASRSSTGAMVVGGGMLAKTLYDRRKARKARARLESARRDD